MSEKNVIVGISKSQSSFNFWQKWLFYSSLIFAFSGIAFAFYGSNILFSPYIKMLAKIFWSQDEFPQQAELFRRFIYAPLGGTITCCYILLAFIAKFPFKEKQKWAWNAIAMSFTIWFLIDSSACIYYNVLPQIYIINLFSISVKLLPLIFTRKHFIN